MSESIYRQVGRTELNVTELGFGGGAIAGLYRAVSRGQAFEAMTTAWDAGLRYFDTAPYYGHGSSERLIGDFLRDKDSKDYVLSTKVGKLLRPVSDRQVPDYGYVKPLPFRVEYDYSYDGIMRSFEFSLARLGLSRVDILYVHDLEPATLGKPQYERQLSILLNSGIKALNELKSAGTIKAFGLGVNELQPCIDVMTQTALDCLLIAGRYTLLDRRGIDEVFTLCQKVGATAIIGGVFNSGILATGAIEGAKYNYAEADQSILNRVKTLEEIANRNKVSLAAAALAFPLRHPLVSSVLIGTAKAGTLSKNVEWLKQEISEGAWGEFDAYGCTD